MQKYVSVLDFGSSKITVACGTKNVNNNLNIFATGVSDYAGYMDGEFIEPNLLRECVANAINNAQVNINKKISKLYVGIPAEFCVNEVQDVCVSFKSKTLLKKSVISNLFNKNEVNNLSSTHSVINKSPVYYILDNSSKVINPIGSYATNMVIKTSYVYIENKIMALLSSVFSSLGIKEYVFISSTLAQATYLLNSEVRYSGAYFVDVGYISSSVCSVMGDGLVDLKSFSIGGAHITSDLSELLNLPFLQAEQLKRKLILTLKPSAMDFYEVFLDNKIAKLPVKSANEIALARIDMIIEMIEKLIKNFSLKANNNIIYLSGGGIALIRGIKSYLNKRLGKKVKIVVPEPMQLAKPEYSSIVSLLNTAFELNKF